MNASLSVTFTATELPNGCVAPNTAPACGIARRIMRQTAPRRSAQESTAKPYYVKIDGESHWFSRIDALRRFLGSVAIGARCRIFANGLYGVTLDFDAA